MVQGELCPLLLPTSAAAAWTVPSLGELCGGSGAGGSASRASKALVVELLLDLLGCGEYRERCLRMIKAFSLHCSILQLMLCREQHLVLLGVKFFRALVGCEGECAAAIHK